MSATLDLEAVHRAAAWCSLVGQGDAVVEYHESTGSTNDRAFELANEDAPEGSIVVAGRQEAGRGRLGKTWASPSGGLYVSILLRPDTAMLRRLPVTLLGGVAVAEAIEETTPLTTELKWPNDVHIDGKKVAGILGELKRDVLVLGIGINIVEPKGGLEGDAKDSAAFLSPDPPKAEAVLAELLKRFEDHYQSVRAGGGVGILSSASARMPMLGKKIRIALANRTLTGIASGLTQTGALVVELEDGTRDVFVAGEVEEVRRK